MPNSTLADKPKPTWRDYCTTKKPEGKTVGLDVINWIEAHCVHTNGRWIGKPFRLLPWQKWIIMALFTLGSDDRRIIRWALIGIAKKNGKTELCAALALFFAFGPSGIDGEPEPAALVCCAAGNEEQADLVFGAAKTMAEMSPTLSQILTIFDAEIVCKSLPGSKVVRVAAAATKKGSTLDGKNIYVVICDELHVWDKNKGENVWNTLTNGTGARDQPMILQITTAGYDLEDSVCGRQYQYGKRVAQGEIDDPHYFFWWVEPPEGANYRDYDVIEAANPSFGITVNMESFRDQLKTKSEATFRRYFLNQWTSAEELFLPHGAWERLDIGPFEFDPNEPIFTGSDASTKYDSTAHVIAQWNPENGKLRIKAKVWDRPIDPRSGQPLEGWRVPQAEVEQYLRELNQQYDLIECAYDPMYMIRMAEALEADGLPMVEFPQSPKRLAPATERFYQMAVRGQLEHDGDPVLARHVRNASTVAVNGGDGGRRLSKSKQANKKMDAALAAALAIDTAVTTLETSSVYEDREMLAL